MKETFKYKAQKFIFTVLGDIAFSLKFGGEAGIKLLFGINPPAYSFRGDELYDCIDKMANNYFKPGDIFLRRYDTYLDNKFIPGDMKHAGVYIGKDLDGRHCIVHALSEGVIKENFVNFLRCDHLVVVRPRLPEDSRYVAANNAYNYFLKNTPYDFDFRFTDDSRLCCTELIGASYESAKNMFKFDLVVRYGRKTLIADDIILSPVDMIYHSKGVDIKQAAHMINMSFATHKQAGLSASNKSITVKIPAKIELTHRTVYNIYYLLF